MFTVAADIYVANDSTECKSICENIVSPPALKGFSFGIFYTTLANKETESREQQHPTNNNESICKCWTVGKGVRGIEIISTDGNIKYGHTYSFEYHNAAQEEKPAQMERRVQNTPTISSQPSHYPSSSGQPSPIPIEVPSSIPTTSFQPSMSPSLSASPSTSTQPSSQPSQQPSSIPSTSQRPTSSQRPSDFPSLTPSESMSPSVSSRPSSLPTNMPSNSGHPSLNPSVTVVPTSTSHPSTTSMPSDSGHPSVNPSVTSMPSVTNHPSASQYPTTSEHPTVSDQPSTSIFPTSVPTFQPSEVPSDEPSPLPTTLPSSSSKPSPKYQPSATPSISHIPTSTPTASPIGDPFITVISSNSLFLNVTDNTSSKSSAMERVRTRVHKVEDETITQRKLAEVSDALKQVLEETIEVVASANLTEGQSVQEVKVTNAINRGIQVEVNYTLILQELCAPYSCIEQEEISTMYNDTTNHMQTEVETGGFTSTLQKNADTAIANGDCGTECSILQNATVTELIADTDPDVDISQTKTPTRSPTVAPSKEDILPDQPTSKPTRRKGKARKNGKSKSGKVGKSSKVSSPTIIPATFKPTTLSAKSSKAKSSKVSAFGSLNGSMPYRKRKHTQQSVTMNDIKQTDEQEQINYRIRRRQPSDIALVGQQNNIPTGGLQRTGRKRIHNKESKEEELLVH